VDHLRFVLDAELHRELLEVLDAAGAIAAAAGNLAAALAAGAVDLAAEAGAVLAHELRLRHGRLRRTGLAEAPLLVAGTAKGRLRHMAFTVAAALAVRAGDLTPALALVAVDRADAGAVAARLHVLGVRHGEFFGALFEVARPADGDRPQIRR